MKAISFFAFIACALLITGCASNSAIRAYAIVAEEHASVMKVTFDRCLNEQNSQAKEAACNAVKSSIDAYRQSAAELKTIKSTN